MQYRVYKRQDLSYVDSGYVSPNNINIDDDYLINNNSVINILKPTKAVIGDIIAIIKDSGAYHKGIITEVDNADLTISYKSAKELFNDNIINPYLSKFIDNKDFVGKIDNIEKELSKIIKLNFVKPPLEVVEGYYNGKHFYSDSWYKNKITCTNNIAYVDKNTGKGYLWDSNVSKNIFVLRSILQGDNYIKLSDQEIIINSKSESFKTDILISLLYKTLSANKQYTLSWKWNGSYKGNINLTLISTTKDLCKVELTSNKITFTTSSIQKLSTLKISIDTIELNGIKIGNIQLEEGENATSYLPYDSEMFEFTANYPYDTYRMLPIKKIFANSTTSTLWKISDNSINLKDLLIDLFNNLNLIVDFNIDFSGNEYGLTIKIGTVTSGNILIKNNIKVGSFIYENATVPDKTCCVVIDSGTKEPLAKYYLKTDNTLTTNALDEKRALPSKTVIAEYSTSNSVSIDSDINSSSGNDDPYYDSAAQELLGSSYYELVQFEVDKESKMINFPALVLGTKVRIINEQGTINTIYTGRKEKGSERYVTLMFGKSRKNYTDKIQLALRRKTIMS